MSKKKQKRFGLSVEPFRIFAKGFLMGIADAIPGVSGGTIALITGIYERLIRGLTGLNYDFLVFFLKGDRERAYNHWKRIDFALFIPLGIGIAIALFIFSGVMGYLLEEWNQVTFAFFFGLILAAGMLLFRKIRSLCFSTGISFLAGLMLSLWIAGLSGGSGIGHSYLAIFVSGAIAICAMILPGISGAFILLLLGQYEYLIGVLHSLDIIRISVFGLGGAVGLLSFARLLDLLLRRFPYIMMAFLTGLMIGALRVPFEVISGSLVPAVFLAGLIGFIVVFLMEHFFRR